MIRALQTLGVLALVCAGGVSLDCADRWRQGNAEIGLDSKLPVVKRFRRTSGGAEVNREPLSPLVEQATAFASYLSPPEPTRQRKTHKVTFSGKKTVAPVELPETTAKFTLIATSYYGARPDKSLALVSEPGKATRWVRPGTRLGHFVLEKVEQGSIVYRDGDRSSEMAVETKIPSRHEDAPQMTLASGETETAPPERPTSRKPRKTRERPPMKRLGPVRPESPLLVRDRMSTKG